MQLEGIFDIEAERHSSERWTDSFEFPNEWSVGAIVGPSGSGKTTVAREIFGDGMAGEWTWSAEKSVLDDFPQDMGIKEIIGLLSSVGFSSPPSWMRPFRVLSNGEKFRVSMARTLAELPDIAVVDEFTSVVDRTVAQMGSAAIQKTARRRGRKFVAVSCHYDILDWLEPDWVYQPHTREFYSGRYLHRRPQIDIEVRRVHHAAWKLFREYHYLNSGINKSSRCFVGLLSGAPVVFAAVLHFPHPSSRMIKREHRVVCLPDYQGVGIGGAMSAYVGSVVTALNYRYLSITSHPAMVGSRNLSANWKMTALPNRTTKAILSGGLDATASGKGAGRARRLRATFEYVGARLDRDEAKKVWDGDD